MAMTEQEVAEMVEETAEATAPFDAEAEEKAVRKAKAEANRARLGAERLEKYGAVAANAEQATFLELFSKRYAEAKDDIRKLQNLSNPQYDWRDEWVATMVDNLRTLISNLEATFASATKHSEKKVGGSSETDDERKQRLLRERDEERQAAVRAVTGTIYG